MDKRRILIVVHQLNIGGVQKALLSALNAIDYERNDVTLYVRKKRVDLLPDVNPNVTKVFVNNDTTHYYRKPYSVLLLFMSVIWRILGKKENVFHQKLCEYVLRKQYEYEQSHYFLDSGKFDVAISYIQGYTAQFVAEFIPADKKVMFFHGSTDETHYLHEKIMGVFSTICCVSHGALKELQRFYPRFAEKMICVENIVDVEQVRHDAMSFNVDKPDGKMVLCSCGRFTHVKGFDIAVEAAKILKEMGIQFFWYFVGDGTERQRIESLIESNDLQENIVITGMQSNPYPYMAACDVYVQPSREEAQGLSIIEAQVLYRSVISTRTAGGQSLVKDGINGLLTDIDAVSLVNGIKHLAGNGDLRKRMGEALKNIGYSEKEREFREKWVLLLRN